MNLNFKDWHSVKEHILKKIPTIYTCSKTSTVINYQKQFENTCIADLNQIPKKIELSNDNTLSVQGAVTWQEAQNYLHTKSKQLKCYPTDTCAAIIAGVATSCTGERSFKYGPFRDHIKSVKFIDHQANEVHLNNNESFESLFEASHPIVPIIKKYTHDSHHYHGLKNAPFPMFKTQKDLMIGSEGQLGVVKEVCFSITDNCESMYLAMAVDRWENSTNSHLAIYKEIQNIKNKVDICELIDSNCLKLIDHKTLDKDLIIIGFDKKYFEFIHEWTYKKCDFLNLEKDVFQIPNDKFKNMRVEIPRKINEILSRENKFKKGTDIQVLGENFPELLELYQDLSLKVRPYFLFGHFGDAHLHLNLLPKLEKSSEVDSHLESLYDQILKLKGSPFAEHGIGLLKQKYIKKFYGENQRALFKMLKNIYDPENQFFPTGFMTGGL